MQRHSACALLCVVVLVPVVLLGAGIADAQSPQPRAPAADLGYGFTYQGMLKKNGVPVNATCSFGFTVWDSVSGGDFMSTQVLQSPGVTNGLFTSNPIDVQDDTFNGEARYLEIGVQCPEDSTVTTLARQLLTPAPYALALPALRIQPNATSPNLIGGYKGNWVTSGVKGAVIAGGGTSTWLNRVTDDYGVVGGGYDNVAGNNAGTTTDMSYATVGGGLHNKAENYAATVGGGNSNYASGRYATIPGGAANIAAGQLSLAAGYRAAAYHNGAFVWGDSTEAELSSTANNQFLVRASGGITMYTNSGMTTGVRVLPGGGSWASASDRNIKANLAPTDGKEILARVNSIPIETWNYQAQDVSIRHIGPMAQDFYAALQVGEDDKHITTIDADGVALAAIQGLSEIAQEQEARIGELEQQNASLESRLAAVERAAGIATTSPLDLLNYGGLIGLALVAGMWIGRRAWGGDR